jgi:hypothetical protein
MINKRLLNSLIFLLLALSLYAQQAEQTEKPFWQLSRAERRKVFEERYKKRFEPDGKARRAHLQQYVEKFQNINISDPKSSYFKVNAKTRFLSSSITLEGEVLFKEYRSGIERTLSLLGFKKLQNSISVLPDPRLGTHGFALATTYTVSLYRETSTRSEMLDQVLYGDPVRLLKISDDQNFFLAQAPDGYIGWVSKDFLQRIDLKTWHSWRARFPRARIMQNITAVHPVKNRVLEIPRGALLPLTQPPSGAKASGSLFVLLPDGGTLPVSPRVCEIVNLNPDRSREKILQLATCILGIKYVWAGSSDRGIDCSGFTNHLYGMIGVNLPRDADQQSAVGEIVAFRGYLDNLMPGDLLFFLSRTGRVSHVAMSLGGLDFIHSSHPGVKYGSFDPESPYYDKRHHERFAFARRILVEGF